MHELKVLRISEGKKACMQICLQTVFFLKMKSSHLGLHHICHPTTCIEVMPLHKVYLVTVNICAVQPKLINIIGLLWQIQKYSYNYKIIIIFPFSTCICVL